MPKFVAAQRSEALSNYGIMRAEIVFHAGKEVHGLQPFRQVGISEDGLNDLYILSTHAKDPQGR